MTRSRGLFLLVAFSLLSFVVVATAARSAAQNSGGGCAQWKKDVDGNLVCVVHASSSAPPRQNDPVPASVGNNRSSLSQPSESAAPTTGLINRPATCEWHDLVPQPNPGDYRLELHDPSEGVVQFSTCNFLNGPQYRFLPNPDAPPPPTPDELAARAAKEILLPLPSPHVGPHADKIAVKIPVWLWIDPAAPITITIAAGGIGLTATATLTGTNWSMGEAAAHEGGVGEYVPGPQAQVTCTGAGTPAPAGTTTHEAPPCGYTYHWRSLSDRTGGTCRWPLSVTATWTLDWATTTGVTGELTAQTAPATDSVRVGEYRTVLIDPNLPVSQPDTTTCG